MKLAATSLAVTALLLAGCGGGGNDSAVPIPAQFPTTGVVPVTSMAGVECG